MREAARVGVERPARQDRGRRGHEERAGPVLHGALPRAAAPEHVLGRQRPVRGLRRQGPHDRPPVTSSTRTFSGWDIYRSQVQLAAMVAPQQTSDSVRSMLNEYDQMRHAAEVGLRQRRELRDGRGPGRRASSPTPTPSARATSTPRRPWPRWSPRRRRPTTCARRSRCVTSRATSRTTAHYGCCNFYGSASTQLEYDTRRLRHRLVRPVARQRLGLPARSRPGSQDWQNIFNPATGYVQAKLANGSGPPASRPSTEHRDGRGHRRRSTRRWSRSTSPR